MAFVESFGALFSADSCLIVAIIPAIWIIYNYMRNITFFNGYSLVVYSKLIINLINF
jgi:hypothetical protein